MSHSSYLTSVLLVRAINLTSVRLLRVGRIVERRVGRIVGWHVGRAQHAACVFLRSYVTYAHNRFMHTTINLQALNDSPEAGLHYVTLPVLF